MKTTWKTIVWQQFGAAIDMLNNALVACPDEQWQDTVWHDPSDDPKYTEFWYIIYHTLYWTDRYLSGSPEGFAPPVPFVAGSLPENPYSKKDLHAYLKQCRQKCEETFEALTNEKANQICQFPWGEDVSFAELQLYSMRHVQEHAAQLSLHLGQNADSGLDWVARAGE